MRIVILMAFGVAATTAGRAADQPATENPSFEVASVRPSAMDDRRVGMGFFTFPGGRIVANMCKLDYLIQLAFDVQPFQISGGPRWIHEDRFDIEAKPPASSKSIAARPQSPKLPPNREQRQMLQTLLAQRFRLQHHLETKDGPVYLLVRTNKPPKLAATEHRDAEPWVGSAAGAAISQDGLRGINASMQFLATRLSPYLEHPVLDRTGLMGSFDFKYERPPEDGPSDLISSIMISVQALGLKLEAGRGPVQTLFIDHVEKPTAN